MLLSYGKPVRVSSGEGAEKATDENIRTWWKAASEQPGEWVEVDLGKTFDVRAIQINFADDHLSKTAMPEGSVLMAYDERFIDKNSRPVRWLLEGSTDRQRYFTIKDKTNAQTDLAHDCIMPEGGVQVRYLRLTIKQLPYDQTPCVSGIRVFGIVNGPAPQKAAGVSPRKTGDLDMEVSWEPADAVGYTVLWGYAPEKLYHSYLVFGKTRVRIGALIKGEPVYVRIDTFNESGITEGDVVDVYT